MKAVPYWGYKPFAYSVNGVVKRNPNEGSNAQLNVTEALPAGEKDVNIVVYFVPNGQRGQYYIITVDPRITDGTVTVNPQVAKEHETITVTVKPNAGYSVLRVGYDDLDKGRQGGTAILTGETASFEMKSCNTQVGVIFKRISKPLSFKVLLEGAGVKDAEVTVTDDENKVHPPTGTLKTNESGVATVAEVPVLLEKGKVTVVATLGGVKHTVKIPVTTNGNGEATPNSFNFRKVEVMVLDRKTNGALEGATVSFGGQDVVLDGGQEVKIGAQEVKTDSDGKATLYLVSDVKNVVVEKTGYRSVTVKNVKVGGGEILLVTLNRALPDVTFTVSPGTKVTINGNGGTYTATAEAGKTEVKVSSVPDIATGGTVTVKATIDGQERVVTVPVTVTNGTASPSDLTLHEVTVKVVELGATPERPIANATVTAGGADLGEDGRGRRGEALPGEGGELRGHEGRGGGVHR